MKAAAQAARRQTIEFAHGVLDAVSAHIAVLDPSGEIVAVNEAWQRFARHNGNPPAALAGVGANYLAACRAAEARGDPSAGEARRGIESVMQGRQPGYACEYPCHSAQEQRWFVMRVSRMPDNGDTVVAHENITARRLAEDGLRASHDELEARVRDRTAELELRNDQLRQEIAERERIEQRMRLAAKVFDSAVEAILIADDQQRIVTVNRAFSRITGYAPGEVIGMNPRLFSSGRHGEVFYASLWQSLTETGQWQGEIWNRRKNGEIFPAWESISVTRDADGRTVDYISVFSDISAAKQAEERLAYLAHHDPLTGLANRLLFSARLDRALERAQRHQSSVALLFIDMDNFKFINDSLGHLVGDRYLKTMAERLTSAVRAEDTVARLGGDEFAILMEDLDHAQDAGRLADKIGHLLAQGLKIADQEVASSASIGISIFPDDARSAEALLKAADVAMYRAKGEGRNTVRFYRAEMSARAGRRMALENGLRQALSRGELVLHYQPLVDLATMQCVGLEALLRWHSPEQGWLMPEDFIPLAEETRLIQPIGRWVIAQALRDLAGWRAAGLPPVRLAVNVSWRQFNDTRFVDQLVAAMQAHGLPAQDLVLDLEITESALQNGTRSVADLHRLRAHGVRVMIDDFGTGHSSLGQLMNLPVDGLKIDRMFLRDAAGDQQGRAIVRAVIALAGGLGLNVVCEGVETEAQLAMLRAEGCRTAQGLLLGKPVPAEQVPALLAPRPIAGAPAGP